MGVNATLSTRENLATSRPAGSGANGGGMFVRSVVGGQPASPGYVIFFVDRNIGTRSFTFVAPPVGAGAYTLAIQRHTGGGTTAFIEDRALSVVSRTCHC